MSNKKRTYTSAFKTKIVLEALREEKSIAELSVKYNITPKNIHNWKATFLSNAEIAMGAPSKVRKVQAVKIHSMQSLTSSIEPTTAWQEVTNVVKPVEGTYQAATKVKVLSPVIVNIIEADVLHYAEGSTKDDVMVSHHSLYRGLSPWHGMRWNLRELGRSLIFLQRYAGTRQQSQELANNIREVGLIDSTLSMGKLCTWGSGQQWRNRLDTSLTNTQRLA